jgi:vitamin K-dependent gamma-carboxylase
VMVRAKLGSVDYRVRLRDGRELHVSPRRYLTAEQEREMSGQPDLILQLAHHIGRELAARGHGDAQVFVDARVSLNGRKPALLIEPEVNLLEVRDGLARAAWIRGEPGDEPIRLEPAQRVAQVVR